MIRIIEDENEQYFDGEKYFALMDYLLTKCDKVAFCLPNFGTTFNVCCDMDCTQKYESIKETLDRDNAKFFSYKEKVKPLLQSLENKIIKIWRHNEYFDQKCNYEKEIYLIKFDEETVSIFKTIGGLDKWCHPDLPEDLYFFAGSECYFAMTSHECEYEIYDDSDEIADFLSELSVDFDDYDSSKAPSL